MVHLSRLAEEIAWWSNPRFGFVRVAEAYSTGSSMMPNKRNPDPAELVRGRSARVIAALTAILGILKGLPLGYQRDLQEDKPPLFGAIATYEASLRVMAGLVATLGVDREAMADAANDGCTTATTLADALVRADVPFRTAHHVVGQLVAKAEASGVRTLAEMPVSEFRHLLTDAGDPAARVLAAHPDAVATLLGTATIQASLEAADVVGGTAPARVRGAIAAARERLDATLAARAR
jgi:argininosuccinate lyase